jgi:hypothetical protein
MEGQSFSNGVCFMRPWKGKDYGIGIFRQREDMVLTIHQAGSVRVVGDFRSEDDASQFIDAMIRYNPDCGLRDPL